MRLERMARTFERDLAYGLVPWHRTLEDRALELVEQEMWRKRYGARKAGSKGARELGRREQGPDSF
jgi:hypothetical protein